MTSKISFSKLRKENMRHLLPTVLLTAFCFFLQIMTFIISAQNYLTDKDITQKEFRNMMASLIDPNYFWGFIVIVLAVCMSMKGFYYLHSKVQTDFYHSLPVKRTTFFDIAFVNNVLIFVLCMLAAAVIQSIFAGVLGCFTKVFVKNMAASFLCYLLIYLIVFFTAALAMIMTGHIITGALGFGVFSAYAPVLIRGIFPTYSEVFFKTATGTVTFGEGLDYFSPFSLYSMLINAQNSWTFGEHKIPILVTCIWIIVLGLLSRILFAKRCSEMAGKAMAFPKVNPIIRILLVIPMALYVGIFLYTATMGMSIIWMVLGIIFGAWLFHGLIECIYQFDIRGLVSHKAQLAVSMVICFLIVAGFGTDIFGYDKYLPKQSDLQAVVVELNDFSEREDYYWGAEKKGVSGEELKAIFPMLKEVVEDNRTEDYKETGNYENIITVTYKLKNGAKKERRYYCSSEVAEEMLNYLFASTDYKNDLYSLYTADWSQVTDITWENMIDSENVKLTEEERNQFFTTYLDELSNLSYTELKTIPPVSSFTVYHNNRNEEGYSDEMYFIYPTFTKTIAFLEEKGYAAGSSLADAKIKKLDITEYSDDGEENTYSITDPQIIEAVKEKLVPEEYTNMMENNGFANYDYSMEINVHIQTEYGNQEVIARTDIKTAEILE